MEPRSVDRLTRLDRIVAVASATAIVSSAVLAGCNSSVVVPRPPGSREAGLGVV